MSCIRNRIMKYLTTAPYSKYDSLSPAVFHTDGLTPKFTAAVACDENTRLTDRSSTAARPLVILEPCMSSLDTWQSICFAYGSVSSCLMALPPLQWCRAFSTVLHGSCVRNCKGILTDRWQLYYHTCHVEAFSNATVSLCFHGYVYSN